MWLWILNSSVESKDKEKMSGHVHTAVFKSG